MPGGSLRGLSRIRVSQLLGASVLLLSAATLPAATASAAPPDNDAFGNAAELPSSGPHSSLAETTLEATAETGEPAHAGQAARNSAWYLLAPAATSYYRIRICPSASSPVSRLSLAAYTGDDLASLSELASDTDSHMPGSCTSSSQTRIEFLAQSGVKHWIAIDTPTGNAGGFNLFVDPLPPPANDPFDQAETLSLGTSISETNGYATSEAAESFHAGQMAKHSVWYSFTPEAGGVHRIRTCPSAGSPVSQLALVVYTGTELSGLTELASDHDFHSPGSCFGGSETRVEFVAQAGATYMLVVDSAHPTGGGFNLFVERIDDDGDGISNVNDQCPTVAGPDPSGCPSIERSLTLRYSSGQGGFKGKLGPAGLCRAGEPVDVFKRRPGPDKELGSATTDDAGKYLLERARKPGRYYASAEAIVEPTQGACESARSPNLKLS